MQRVHEGKAGEMLQVVKCLPDKHKNLSWVLRTYVKISGVRGYTDNLSPGQVVQEETWGSVAYWSTVN